MNEMNKLIGMLEAAGIPFDVTESCGAPQVCYPVGPASNTSCVCDVVCHIWSYGGNEGLLEILGLVSEDYCGNVEGWLTAEDVFARIKDHYDEQNSAEKVYTFDKNPGCYTEDCNAAMEYIVRNLAGVTVTAEKGDLIQVSAIDEAAEALEMLNDCDMISLYRDMNIEEVEEMVET